MVSKANSAGGGEIPSVSESGWAEWDLSRELHTDPDFRSYWDSLPAVADRKQLVAGQQMGRLRKVRKNLGISQVELAAKMGVSQIRVSQIENGLAEKFELGTLIRYVMALGGEISLAATVAGVRVELLDFPETQQGHS